MFNFDEIMGRLCNAQEILRTTNLVEDESGKKVLLNTCAEILSDTAKMLTQEEGDDDE